MAEADLVRAYRKETLARTAVSNKASKKQTLRDEQARFNNSGQAETRGFEKTLTVETLVQAAVVNKAIEKQT
jgi:hypothetical protein